jgi:hypothetical protein
VWALFAQRRSEQPPGHDVIGDVVQQSFGGICVRGGAPSIGSRPGRDVSGCDAEPMSDGNAEPDYSVARFLRRNARLRVMGVLVGRVAFLVGAVVPTTSPWQPMSLVARLTYLAALLFLGTLVSAVRVFA